MRPFGTQQALSRHTQITAEQYQHLMHTAQQCNIPPSDSFEAQAADHLQMYMKQQEEQMRFTHQSYPMLARAPEPQNTPEYVSKLAYLPQSPHSSDTITVDKSPTTWLKNRDALYYYGRVGINTHTPQESLTVKGNIMVTGDIFKPSDRRLKENFVPVNSAVQLNIINSIKIYDYDIPTGTTVKRERGVIAQEVAKLLPSAVQQVGEYMHNGQFVDNLLVVNERVLLMENIGATQQLNRVVQEDRAEIDTVNAKVAELEAEERVNLSYIEGAVQSMATYVLSEEFRENPRDAWIYCGFSLFGLGPAWSMFVLGFFCPLAWPLGILCISNYLIGGCDGILQET
jgi:hypothetical protein